MVKKKKPKFKRQQNRKKLKDVWRKARGRHSGKRKGKKGKGKRPKIGYSSPSESRGLVRGKKEVLVHNPEEVKKIDPEGEVAVIGSSVGKKKRMAIIKTAEEEGIEVANRKKLL